MDRCRCRLLCARIGERLVRCGQPNHSPLADRELHESQGREKTRMKAAVIVSLAEVVCVSGLRFPIGPPYHGTGTDLAVSSCR